MTHKFGPQGKPVSGFAVALWILTFLFCLRVLGQLIQQISPLPWLPNLEEWQGSALPYWLLLTVQLAIIAVMVLSVRRYTSGNLVRRPTQGKWLLSLRHDIFCRDSGTTCHWLSQPIHRPMVS